jgi:predicted aspartyl protease
MHGTVVGLQARMSVILVPPEHSKIEIECVERNVAVLAMGRRPLIGTALLEDYHLSIDFCEGGTVLVDDIL